MTTTASSGMKQVSQRRAIEASLQNEQITRERVQRLESRVGKLEEIVGRPSQFVFSSFADRLNYHAQEITELNSLLRFRGFWGRLKWLMTGK